jgi:hypothetical protein
MDEIAALQAKLQEVQLQSTAHRFSERNCVELILKLVEKGEIDVLCHLGRCYSTGSVCRLSLECLAKITSPTGN